MKILWQSLLLLMALSLVGCGTTDSQMQAEGRSQAYIDGFHDGSRSGTDDLGK